MMCKFIDVKTGFMRLDEMVMERPSYQAVIADNIVSDAEISAQSNLVVALFQKLDDELCDGDRQLVIDAIAELSVLYEINAIKEGANHVHI